MIRKYNIRYLIYIIFFNSSKEKKVIKDSTEYLGSRVPQGQRVHQARQVTRKLSPTLPGLLDPQVRRGHLGSPSWGLRANLAWATLKNILCTGALSTLIEDQVRNYVINIMQIKNHGPRHLCIRQEFVREG